MLIEATLISVAFLIVIFGNIERKPGWRKLIIIQPDLIELFAPQRVGNSNKHCLLPAFY